MKNKNSKVISAMSWFSPAPYIRCVKFQVLSTLEFGHHLYKCYDSVSHQNCHAVGDVPPIERWFEVSIERSPAAGVLRINRFGWKQDIRASFTSNSPYDQNRNDEQGADQTDKFNC